MTPGDPEQNKLKARETLAHLDALEASPAFAWFMTNVLEKARRSEREAALDLSKSPEDRDRACCRYDLAKALCNEPSRMRSSFNGFIHPQP